MSPLELDHSTGVATGDPMLPDWYTVERVRRENHDTFTLELRARDGETHFAFLPGQFNMLYVFGVGEAPISISGNPAATDRVVHTTRAVGTVTRAMWRFKRGDAIGVRGPFGTHWPVEQAEGRDLVLVTGGIGLAPLRPVIYHVLAHRQAYGRVVLLYGARTPDDLLYDEELLFPPQPLSIDVDVTVDRAVAGWRGRIGVVTSLISRAPIHPDNAVAMLCGPEVMMRFAVQALMTRGVPVDRIYVSLERNMKCGVGFCGHCQYGPAFICRDGPVFRFDAIERFFGVREI
ncbi:MAG: FAD/NAD(P)-binding protein [Phycisphaerales bacterium]|nr:FAD/NAD(P)-binding protein [Phycisphaerales bacterium]